MRRQTRDMVGRRSHEHRRAGNRALCNSWSPSNVNADQSDFGLLVQLPTPVDRGTRRYNGKAKISPYLSTRAAQSYVCLGQRTQWNQVDIDEEAPTSQLRCQKLHFAEDTDRIVLDTCSILEALSDVDSRRFG